MALSADEQNLLDFALAALPPWFRDEGRDLAVEAGMAKMVGAARTQAAYWFGQSLITTATGPGADTPDWLQQHAIDRGTRRQNGEGDPELRSRLRTYPDALTRATLLSVAQAVLTAAGVVGDVAMLELRRDRGYLVVNQRQADATLGGEFIDHGANVFGFLPAIDWAWWGGKPPFRGPGIEPPITYKLYTLNAAEGGNEGTFTITGLDGNEILFTNPLGTAGADASVFWRVDRYDRDGNCLTGQDEGLNGKLDTYLSRGHRVGATWSSILLILPFGTSAAVAASVEEAIRQRKAAGVRVIVERRQNP